MLATRPTRTFADLARHVRAAEEKHTHLTRGEVAMTVLWRVWPDLAREIEGTDADPSRDSSRLPAFWCAVGEAYDRV